MRDSTHDSLRAPQRQRLKPNERTNAHPTVTGVSRPVGNVCVPTRRGPGIADDSAVRRSHPGTGSAKCCAGLAQILSEPNHHPRRTGCATADDRGSRHMPHRFIWLLVARILPEDRSGPACVEVGGPPLPIAGSGPGCYAASLLFSGLSRCRVKSLLIWRQAAILAWRAATGRGVASGHLQVPPGVHGR